MLYSVAALLLGAQFISMGFLAELFTAYYGQSSASYSVKQRTGQTVAAGAAQGAAAANQAAGDSAASSPQPLPPAYSARDAS